MREQFLLIFLLGVFNIMMCNAGAGSSVCDCCRDKYGLGCEQWSNGWEVCAEDQDQDLEHDAGDEALPKKKLVPLDEDGQCEGTLCPSGCCPEKCWYCCPDEYCVPTEAEC